MGAIDLVHQLSGWGVIERLARHLGGYAGGIGLHQATDFSIHCSILFFLDAGQWLRPARFYQSPPPPKP